MTTRFFEDPHVTDTTIKHPRPALSFRLCRRLSHWVPAMGTDRCEHERPRAQAAVEQIDHALAMLEKKKGPRAEAARTYLTDMRTPIAAVIELVDSVGGQFDGPLGVELANRIRSTRVAYKAALAAKETSTRATVEAALLEIEKCLADLRELDRDIQSVNDRLVRVPLIAPEVCAEAKNQTRALESAQRVTVHDIRAAIDQGLAASPLLAALFVAFETEPAHELVALRARAIAEQKPAIDQAAAAE